MNLFVWENKLGTRRLANARLNLIQYYIYITAKTAPTG